MKGLVPRLTFSGVQNLNEFSMLHRKTHSETMINWLSIDVSAAFFSRCVRIKFIAPVGLVRLHFSPPEFGTSLVVAVDGGVFTSVC